MVNRKSAGRRSPSTAASTSESAYTERLIDLQTVWWKRVLPVQAPYRYNLRRLPLGRVLEIGCGLGRNLEHLRGNGVGVDHNPDFVAYCRQRGIEAYTSTEFESSAAAETGSFDSLILVHVIEHLDDGVADEILRTYLPYVRSRGYAHFITPQERGYRTDPTHVRFTDFDALHALAGRHGLTVERSYSFPFPRRMGRAFVYNEFNVLARLP